MTVESDPRPFIYKSLHEGRKEDARKTLWDNIGNKTLFSDTEWDRLYIRAGGVDEADKISSVPTTKVKTLIFKS